MSDQWEQDSNLGGWRKERFIMLVAQHLDLSKNGTGPIAQGWGVFVPHNAEGSKQEGQKQMWQLASRWEVTIYHISTRLQLFTLAHLWNWGLVRGREHICETWPGRERELAFISFPWVSLSFPSLILHNPLWPFRGSHLGAVFDIVSLIVI
jgi:hypothetical protein